MSWDTVGDAYLVELGKERRLKMKIEMIWEEESLGYHIKGKMYESEEVSEIYCRDGFCTLLPRWMWKINYSSPLTSQGSSDCYFVAWVLRAIT